MRSPDPRGRVRREPPCVYILRTIASLMRCLPCCVIIFTVFALGCTPVRSKLTFPEAPLQRSPDAWWYDTNGDGKRDFGLLRDESGKFNILAYDDDQDGKPDRIYRLSDYDNADVPHLVILLDST